jgi:hypothetical protein
LAFVLVATLAGCSAQPATRAITGQLRAAAPNSVVVAQSASHRHFTAAVAATGRFTLQLATGDSYALDVGPARIDWPTATGPARWAKLGSGPTLDLGHVAKTSDGHYECDHHGSNDDHCDRDDSRDGGDDDDHGDDDGDHDGGDHDDGDHDGDHHACDGGTHAGGGDLGGLK